MKPVNVDYLLTLAAISLVLLAIIHVLRGQAARRGSGRLAQLRFRRLHGARVVELLGGRLDPQRGSPWIETYVDGRVVRLVAAPVEGRLQAGIQLLQHEIPVNVWHTSGELDELEAPASIDQEALDAIVAELRDADVDSVACGASIDSDPRPPHIVRMRFDDVEDVPRRLELVAPLLKRLEALGAAP